MSKNSERVKKWRRTTKKRLINSLGGECCICGYNKCDDVLEFHHIAPNEKEFSFSQYRGNIKGWDTLVVEIRKCVVLCSNCHKEVHSKYFPTEVPSDAPRFNEDYVDYRQKEKREQGLIDNCPICGKEKAAMNVTCSRRCAAKSSGKVNWNEYDVVAMMSQYNNYEEIGRIIGVTGAAVRKRYMRVTTGKY